MTKEMAVFDGNKVPAIKLLAEQIAKSGLFPEVRTTEAAFALMMLADSEGIHPMQAMRRFHIVQGRPAMKADTMLAEFQERGGKVKWVQHTETVCEAQFTASGLSIDVTVKWTLEDAKRAGLFEKDIWKKYPRQMLRGRVISEGIRMAMPAIIVGIYTPEETEEIPKDRVITVVPEAAPSPPDSPKPPNGQEALTVESVVTKNQEDRDAEVFREIILSKKVELKIKDGVFFDALRGIQPDAAADLSNVALSNLKLFWERMKAYEEKTVKAGGLK